MAIKRITISLPDELAERLKAAAGDKPVSTWVTELIEHELEQEHLDQLWEDYMAEVGTDPEAAEYAKRVIESALQSGSKKGAA